MLKLKDIQTKPVIYQGLEVDVPVDTNFMWLRQTGKKTALWASAQKPEWFAELNLYIPSTDDTLVAELEYAELTAEQVKDSLETDEDLPTAQDLEQLEVVENLVKNLHGFASNLARTMYKVKSNSSSKNIQALIQHVYADGGELDTLITNIITEAEQNGIDVVEDEDTVEDHEALVNFINTILK